MGTWFRWGRQVLLKVTLAFILLLVTFASIILFKDPCQVSLKAHDIDFSYRARCDVEKTENRLPYNREEGS